MAVVLSHVPKDPKLAHRFRERATREITLRWPDCLSLPIMPTGAILLHSNLVRTAGFSIIHFIVVDALNRTFRFRGQERSFHLWRSLRSS